MYKTLMVSSILMILGHAASAVASAAVFPDSPIPEKWSDLLKKVVEINSGTENADGLDEVRKILIPEFESLGYKTTVYDTGSGHKVVSFDFPNAGSPQLLMIGHIDTVFPKTSNFQKISQDGDHLSGPGVMDMKGGDIMILNLLTDLSAHGNGKILRQIRILLNDDEEIGSPYSQKKFRELATGVPYALIYEPGLPDGAVMSSQGGVHWIELSVTGKTAHAGADFQNGLNACVALSGKLADIAKLTDVKHSLTVNVGTLEGGTKPNVVCGKASAKIDIRYTDSKKLEVVLKKIKKIADRADAYNPFLKQAPTAEIKEIIHVPSLTADSSQRIFATLQSVAKNLGQKIGGEHTAYASDGNQIAPTGIQVLVGMGPCGENPHTDKEFLIVHTYPERLKLNLGLIHQLIPN
jgi:glutamate carboxypeptidase